MADVADNAAKFQDAHIKHAISQRKAVLPSIGICHWCSNAVASGHFCDADCRDDYERHQHMKNPGAR
jgi:hypothetical protein